MKLYLFGLKAMIYYKYIKHISYFILLVLIVLFLRMQFSKNFNVGIHNETEVKFLTDPAMTSQNRANIALIILHRNSLALYHRDAATAGIKFLNDKNVANGIKNAIASIVMHRVELKEHHPAAQLYINKP